MENDKTIEIPEQIDRDNTILQKMLTIPINYFYLCSSAHHAPRRHQNG